MSVIIRTQVFIVHKLECYLFWEGASLAVPSFRLSVLEIGSSGMDVLMEWDVLMQLNFGKPGVVLHISNRPSTWKVEAG